MSQLTRKEREVQQREQLILDAAREMLLAEGFAAMTMDRIADKVEYSKGTVYQHFSSKEDLLMALHNESRAKIVELFERASAFRGLARERMCAIGQGYDIFVRLYPHYFRTEMMVHGEAFRAKASAERRALLEDTEHRCMTIVSDIVRDAIEEGNLKLSPTASPTDVSYGLWVLSLGAYTIMARDFDLDVMGIEQPLLSLRTNQQVLMDGYGWKPLSTEWDYEKTIERIQAEVFADEYRKAHPS